MRTTTQIVKDLNGSTGVSQENNSSIVRIQLGDFKRPRRTCEKPYISVYKGNAIMTIPYGKENFEFSFSVRKGQALGRMMADGSFDDLLCAAVDLQGDLDRARESGIVLTDKKEWKVDIEI